MKKKILLFASSVLAAMALTVSAYAAVPSKDGNTQEDAVAILQEALQHTLQPTDDNYALYNLDQDKPGLETDITANDAAVAFKRAVATPQFYLEVRAGKISKDIALAPYSGSVDSDEAGVKDMIESYLALDEASKSQKAVAAKKEQLYDAKVKTKVIDYIDKIHFYSGSEKVGEVALKEDLGWAIFASKISPLLVGKDATLIAQTYDSKNKTSSGTAQIAALNLPAVAADGDITFKEVQDAYLAARDQAVNLNESEIPANIKEAAENSMHVGTAYAKYGAKLTLNEGTASEKVYTYNKDKDLTSFNQLVDDATGIYDYNTVTIGKINDVLGTGDVYKEEGDTLVYGTAKLEVEGTTQTKTGTIRLVKKK